MIQVTFPDGVGRLRFAVNVRGFPNNEGFAEVVSVIVIGTGVETAIVNAFGVEPELLSEKVIVKLNGLPAAVVGVPLITPAAGSRASPGGSAPLLMIQFL